MVRTEGVDEVDIVKTDGLHIYLLHGNQLAVLPDARGLTDEQMLAITRESVARTLSIVARELGAGYAQGYLLGRPEEILAAPASEFVARFVGADRGGLAGHEITPAATWRRGGPSRGGIRREDRRCRADRARRR